MQPSLALVLGNAAYWDSSNQLNNAVNDANAVAEKLTLLGYQVILANDCTYQGFKETLHSFQETLSKLQGGAFLLQWSWLANR